MRIRLGVFLLVSCGDGKGVERQGDAEADAGPAPVIDVSAAPLASPEWDVEGCPYIFAQEHLPTFEVEIADNEWRDLRHDWERGQTRWAQGITGPAVHPYHPLIVFRYDGSEVADAAMRVRGNPRWWSGPKMQFQISFNENDKEGRFRGLRKLVLDAAKENRSFLRDRLALWVLRHAGGVPTPCANNARLVINGEYHGLYTNIEKVDHEFLERAFPNPDGNLYKRNAWTKETNEEDSSTSDLETFRGINDLAALEAIANVQELVQEWATEAVLPNADGAWAGGKNYYLYNDPLEGWQLIPWDLDATFTRLPSDVDPFTWIRPMPRAGRLHYDLVLSDPTWFNSYLDSVEQALSAYAANVLQGLIDVWAAQIREAAELDENKAFSNEDFQAEVQALRSFVAERGAYVSDWLACRKSGRRNCP